MSDVPIEIGIEGVSVIGENGAGTDETTASTPTCCET